MPDPQPDNPNPTPNSPINLLLIEDNPGDARLIEVMLEEHGAGLLHLTHTGRLQAGIDHLSSNHVDLVLLDLSLPDSSGINTFITLHQQAPEIPIIVLSGLHDETLAIHSVQQGAQDYLVKGHVDGLLLVRAIRYALERKRIHDELRRLAGELREKNAQMQADLNMAREIQQVFLPHNYPAFPKSTPQDQSALRFHHRYLPAASVSGDFFNILRISDTMAGILICDVMGHGLRAALVTAIMRGLIEELMPLAHRPGPFLSEINRSLLAILRRTDEPLLATAFYLVLDLATPKATFASAGHPSAVRITPNQPAVTQLRQYDPRHGPALGLLETSAYPDCSCPLAANDLFLLFTDGLYEIEGPNQTEYGLDRLLQNLQTHAKLSTPDLFDAVLNDIRHTCGSQPFEDDLCIVGVDVASLLTPNAPHPNPTFTPAP